MLAPSSKRLWGAFIAGAVAAGGVVALAFWLVGGRPSGGPSITETALYYEPTAPIPVARMYTESAPVSAVVVAMPEGQVLGNVRKEKFFLDLIEAATRYVDVVVLVNRDEPLAISKITELIRGRVADSERVLESLTFQRAQIDTEWVRDYGPLFAADHDGKPVLLDNMCRDVRSEAATERVLGGLGFIKTDKAPVASKAKGSSHEREPYLSDYGHFWRRNDDAAPLFFNEILYLRQGRHASLVRPPLQISGGDVAFTEEGQMFTSTRTLELNGGDERRFSRLAKDYFGVERVHYLRPLPRGMWHLDMFLKIAGARAVLLGQFPKSVTSETGALGLLGREANETLEWNRAQIEKRLTGVEVITVPMPPIIPGDRGNAASHGKTGIAELDSALDTEGARLKPMLSVLYRSYLNSLFIQGRGNSSAVLVPRYTGLEELERAVESAYRRAYPGAEIHFVNADVMVDEFGGIHCVTATIPDCDR